MSNYRCTILVADDDRFIRDDLKDLLEADYNLLFSASAKETVRLAAAEQPDMVLLDIKFPDSDDLSTLQSIKRDSPDAAVIILTSQSENISQIVSTIKLGAFDYVTKPFVPAELQNRVGKALELKTLNKARVRMLGEMQSRSGIDNIVGTSPAIKALRESIKRLADVDGCVTIQGESGTGKELVARAMHCLSRRAANPFIAVNCASIPDALSESVFFGHKRGAFTGANETTKGKFEAAEDGTIFLDEIGDMPLHQQTALLRVLEYRTFTPVGESKERACRARFVLATNRDLRERVREGLFREDLYYRIKVAVIELPPLRTRPVDIAALVNHYNLQLSLELGRKPLRVQDEIISLFEKYDWPGNVRELKHVLEGALMLLRPDQEELTLEDLPAELLAARNPSKESASILDVKSVREREDLIKALKQCGGNQSQAAKLLGVHRNTVRTRIRFLGLSDIGVAAN